MIEVLGHCLSDGIRRFAQLFLYTLLYTYLSIYRTKLEVLRVRLCHQTQCCKLVPPSTWFGHQISWNKYKNPYTSDLQIHRSREESKLPFAISCMQKQHPTIEPSKPWILRCTMYMFLSIYANDMRGLYLAQRSTRNAGISPLLTVHIELKLVIYVLYVCTHTCMPS